MPSTRKPRERKPHKRTTDSALRERIAKLETLVGSWSDGPVEPTKIAEPENPSPAKHDPAGVSSGDGSTTPDANFTRLPSGFDFTRDWVGLAVDSFTVHIEIDVEITPLNDSTQMVAHLLGGPQTFGENTVCAWRGRAARR